MLARLNTPEICRQIMSIPVTDYTTYFTGLVDRQKRFQQHASKTIFNALARSGSGTPATGACS